MNLALWIFAGCFQIMLLAVGVYRWWKIGRERDERGRLTSNAFVERVGLLLMFGLLVVAVVAFWRA